MMIKVEAIVREEVFEDVKEALNAIDVNGITVSQVMGCGAQRGYKKLVRGTEVDVVMQPKIKFEIVVSSEEWEKKTIEAIQKAAYTGEVGDGKIFSYEIRTATKIRTKESGYDALNKKFIISLPNTSRESFDNQRVPVLLCRKYQGVVRIGYKMLCDLVITFSGWDIPVQGTGTHAFGVYIVVYIELERNETFIVCLSCNEGLVPLLYVRKRYS